jgi:hypothetical protein
VFVSSEAWVNQLSEEASRARSVAIYTAALSAGFALGPSIVSWTGSEGSLSYVVGGVLSLVALGIVLRFVGAAPEREEEVGFSGGRLALMRLAPVAMAATALNAALETAGLSFLPIYAIRLGWAESAATLLITTLMLGAILLVERPSELVSQLGAVSCDVVLRKFLVRAPRQIECFATREPDAVQHLDGPRRPSIEAGRRG